MTATDQFAGDRATRRKAGRLSFAAAISFYLWVYYQPLWTILSVALAVLVVYALAAYGGGPESQWIDHDSRPASQPGRAEGAEQPTNRWTRSFDMLLHRPDRDGP